MSFTTAILSVGTGLQVASQLSQAKTQQQVFNFNSAINRQQAELTKQAGTLQIERLRRDKVRFRKRQEAAFAGAGVVPGVGSPLEVIADTASELEFDIMIQDFNTRIGVLNATSSAELNQVRGSQARTAGFINAGTTLLSVTPSFIASRGK